MLRGLRVIVDGQELASLKPGESADLPLSPGHHEVQGAMDWARSPVLDVELAGGTTSTVEVSMPFSEVFRAFVTPERAVRARVVPGPTDRG